MLNHTDDSHVYGMAVSGSLVIAQCHKNKTHEYVYMIYTRREKA